MDVWEDALGLERWKLGSHLKVWQGERWRTQTAREDFGARPTRRQGLSGLVSYQETPPARERRGLGFRGSALSRSSPESGAGHRLGALQPERGPRPDVVSRLPGPSLLAPAFRFGHIELLGILKCPTLSSPLRICLCSSFCPECLCLP